MRSFLRRRGFSLVELIMTLSLSLLAAGLLWKGVLFLQHTFSQQMRLQRMSDVLILTQEITKTIREAKRVQSVGPGHLALEIYDHSAYSLWNPRLYETPKLVRYEYRTEGENTFVVRTVYSSTTSISVQPVSTHRFLTHVDLIPPSDALPMFFASYVVGASTRGVHVEFGIHSPLSTNRWVPVKDEAYVQAD